MRRTLTSVGKYTLDEWNVDVSDDKKTFTSKFNIPEAKQIPANAVIKVIVWNKHTRQVYDYGTLGKITHPDTKITRVDLTGKLKFRVVVTEPKSSEILVANTIVPGDMPGEGGEHETLLDAESEELVENIWKLKFEYNVKPTLLINKKIPGNKDWVQDDAYSLSLVLPQVFQEILIYYFIDEADTDEVADEWKRKWRIFAESCASERVPEYKDTEMADVSNECRKEVKTWIESAVDGFCREKLLCSNLIKKINLS